MSDVEDNEAVHIQLNHDSSDSEDENNQIRIQIQADSSSEEEQEPAPVPFRTGLYQPQIPHTIQILPNETPEQTHQRLFEENQLKTIQSEQIAMQIRGQNFEQLQIQRRLQYEQNQAADLEERRQMQEEYQRQVTEKFGPPPASVLESYAAEKNKNNNNHHHHHNNNNNAEPWDDSTLDQLQNRNRGNVSADEQKLMKLRQQHEHGGNNNNNYYQNNNNNRNYNNNNYQQNRNHNNNNNNRNHHNNNYQQQQQQQQPHVYYPQSSHTFLQPTPAPSQHRPHNNYDPNLVALHNLNHHQQQQQQQHHPSYQMPAYQASFAATVHNNYDLVPTSPAYQPPFSAQSTPPERRLIPSKQEEKREFLAQHTAATLAAVVAAANGGVPGALLTPPPPPPPPLEETPDRLRIKDNPFIKQSRMRYITRGIVNIDLTNIKTVEDCDDAVTVLTADLSPYDGLILSDPEEIPELQLNPEPTTKNNNTTDEVQNKPDSEQSPESSQTTAPDLVTDDNNNNNNNLVNVDQGSTQSPSPTGMADGLVAISTSPTDEPFISKKAKEEEEKRLKEEEKRKKEEEKKATEAAAKKAKEDEKKATEAAAKKAKEDKKAADAATKKAKEDEKKAKEDEIKRKKEEEKRKKEEEKLAKKNKGKSPEGTIAVTAAGAAVVGVNNNNNNPETDPQLQQQQQPDKEPSISHKQNDGTENEPSISRQSSETSVINSVLAAGGPNAPCTLPYHDTDFPQPITFEQATIILKSQQPHKIPSKFQKANVFGTSGFRKPDHITCYFYQHLWDTDYDPTNRAHVLLLNAFYMYMNDLVITPNFNNDPLNKGNERPVQCEIPEPTGSHWKDTLRVPNEEQPWSELQGTPARYTILRPLEQDLRPSILTLYLALYLIEGAPNEILKKVVIALLRQFFSRDNAPSAMSYLEIFVPISYVINSLIMSNTTVHAEPFYRMFYKCNLKKEFGQWIPFEDYTLNGFLLAITEYMFVLPLTFWFRHLIQQYDFPTLVCAVRQRLLSNIKLEFDRLDTEYCKGGYATYYHEVMHDNYLAQDLKVVFAEQKKQKHLLTPLEAQIHMNQQQRGPGRNSISYTAPNPTTTTTDETAPKQNKIGPNIVVGKSSTATTAITVTTEPPASPTSSSSSSSTAGPESPATTTTTATTNQTPKARSGPPALKVVANIQRQRAAAAAAKSSTEATAAAATTTDNAIGHDDSGNNTNDDNTPQQDQEEAMNSDQDEDKEKQESSSPQQPHDDTSN